MDGRQKGLKPSLQFRLSIGLSLAVLGVAVIAGIFSYAWAFEEAIELQDEQLIQLAALVNRHRIIQPNDEDPVQISTIDPESHFVVQWLEPSTEENDIAELPDLPKDLADGLQTQLINQVSWRLLVKRFSDNSRVAVAQQTEMRDEIARTSALNTLIPLIILIPLLLTWTTYLLRTTFAPLKKLAIQLDSSNDQDFTSLSEENLTSEISPFVTAINRLLSRLNNAISQQRQFVRDAAHELRSPLTAISMQAERLVELGSGSNLYERLLNLHRATERTRVLIEQLLNMARAQEKQPTAEVNISIKTLLRDILEDLLPLADSKNIEITVAGDDVSINSHPIDLYILIKNIIDNAIRYTPASGNIDIMLGEKNSRTQLIIRDSGPGIEDDEQERVFDPFYRVPGTEQLGSGLGLSIVQTIAQRLKLSIQLYNNLPPDHPGLSVKIVF